MVSCFVSYIIVYILLYIDTQTLNMGFITQILYMANPIDNFYEMYLMALPLDDTFS